MTKAGLTLIAALAAGHAMADTQMIMSDGSEDGMSSVSVSGNMVAFGEDGRAAMIYNAGTEEFTMLNHDQQGYVVMDKAAMKEVRGEMDAMMKQVEEQLANLPPEQREAMMAMMPAGVMDRMKPKKEMATAEVTFTGRSDKVAGYSCKVARITGVAGGATEVCVAKPKALGSSASDVESMDRAFQTMQTTMAQFGQDAPFPSISEMGGVPIRATDSDGTVTTLTSISSDKIDSAMFEIPAGYERQSIME